ncbi:hypothetical protein JXL83_01905 [candidate division WOR-3 bacterium]|nr:hypothetical protein [candidate division WOR-3 bacterium]
MKFPKGNLIIENTKLSFVDFDKVLNASKQERAYKISGYISIIYPESIDLLLVKNGEPYNAITYTHDKKMVIGISEVIDRAKKSVMGIVNFYEVPEELLLFILISATRKPVFSAVGWEKIEKIVSNKETLISKFYSINFTGFLEFSCDIDHNYLKILNGEIVKGYYASKLTNQASWPEFIMLLEEYFKLRKGNILIEGYLCKTDDKEVQASPAQIALFYNAINSTFAKFSEILGKTIVENTAATSYNRIKEQFSFMENSSFENLIIEGSIVTTPQELVRSFAVWFDLIKTSFSSIIGDVEAENFIHQAVHEYRFALKSIGFFEKSSLTFKE